MTFDHFLFIWKIFWAVVTLFTGPIAFTVFMSKINRSRAKTYGERVYRAVWTPWIYWRWIRLDVGPDRTAFFLVTTFCVALAAAMLLFAFGKG